MKSIFKKTTNDASPNNPELPKASKDEGKTDHSITSYFRDLAKKKTPVAPVKQTDEVLVCKKSNEKQGDLNWTSSFSGPKSTDLKQNQNSFVDSKWIDLGTHDFNKGIVAENQGSKDFGSGDSINLPLKARKSTLKKNITEQNEKLEPSTGSMLRRLSMRKEFLGSSESISSASVARRASSIATKDTLKARLEQQRQELTMNFGSAINSSGSISKLKLRDEKAKNMNQDPDLSDAESQDNDVFKSEVSHQDVAKERWISAIKMVMRGLKSTSSVSGKPQEMEIIGAIKREIIDSPQNLTAISGIIKNSNNTKTDSQKCRIPLSNGLAKIISLLRKPAFYRGPEQMNALDLVLKTLPAFSRYSKSFRMKLIEKGYLMDLEPYRVVAPFSMYFILSGKCQSETVVVKNGKGYIRRSNISTGEVFGEFGMSSNEKRGYTVHTITPSILFSVPREVYIEMMKDEVMADKAQKIEILRSIPAFQTVSSTILESFLASCHIYRYDPNVPLLKVGERDNVFFVLEGQCRANRLVPFLVNNETELGALAPEITAAYVPGSETGPDESIVYYNMSIGLLGPGSFFPRISLLRHEGLQYRLQKFDLAKIIVLVNSILKHKPKDEPRAEKTNIAAICNQDLNEAADDMEDMIAGVDLSVTTIDKMTCLVISKMDLINILPEEVLREMTNPDAEGLVGYSMAEIQQNYFDKIQWKGFRNDVVNNVIEKKATIKRN